MPNLTNGRKHTKRTCITRKIARNIVRHMVKAQAKSGENRYWRRERFRSLWKQFIGAGGVRHGRMG